MMRKMPQWNQYSPQAAHRWTYCQYGDKRMKPTDIVEEMMGFPKNWTVSPFQNGAENQSKHTETP